MHVSELDTPSLLVDLDRLEANIGRLQQEHGVVNVQHCARRPRLGEQLRIIPNHACGTTNMHDQVAAHRGGHVEAIWPIAARGMIR
jgi:D-serine deaminase-like pyridoxal phosphate-dependent protein